MDGQLKGPSVYLSDSAYPPPPNKILNSLITFVPQTSLVPGRSRKASNLPCATALKVTPVCFCRGIFSPPTPWFPLIRLSILLRCAGFFLACRMQHFVAATGNFMHPHYVHDVQADTGADPGYTATPGH